MRLLDGGSKTIAGLVALLPLYLAWIDLKERLTPEGLAVAGNPVALGVVAFGAAYAATGSAEHVVAGGAVLVLLSTLLADVDLSRYLR